MDVKFELTYVTMEPTSLVLLNSNPTRYKLFAEEKV